MTSDRNAPRTFDDLAKTAVRKGRSGRREIVRYLAGLPPEKLAQVPASALALIGPAGLAALARKRTDMAGLAPKANATRTSLPELANGEQHRPYKPGRILCITGWCCAILTSAMSFDAVGALTGRLFSRELLPRDASTWPRCQRLDRLTDGCAYETGGFRLTLHQASQYLNMNASDLARLNRHLNATSAERLAAGSLIVIVRDTSRIAGENQ